MTSTPSSTRELISTLDQDGVVTLSIRETELPDLGPGHVLVRVEAAPINPSDLGLMFAGGDVGTARRAEGDRPGVAVDVTEGLGAVQARRDKPMACGNEGAGTVVATGGSPEAAALEGKVVGFISGDSYAEYRVLHHSQCLAMNDGTTPAQAAAWFVNPLTALGMTETMAREGHSALVHTVGASNLGQMLNRICLTDGIPLVNIVRKSDHVALLEGQGAEHVVNSAADSFREDLRRALEATGATVAFDAIGGGTMAGTLLATMEQVASAGAEYSRYGSDVLKQVFIYGRLDPSPVVLDQRFGLSWSVSGWLLTPFLGAIGVEGQARLRARVADEISTTFASTYGMELTLDDVVDVDRVGRYARMTTGEKALIVPHG